jgi:hypothetical protein
VQTAQVEALRALLAPTDWLERTRHFAGTLRRRARTPHGLLIVGTPSDEPWHMTAHLADESELAGLPELEPTLVRWAPSPDGPAHLRIGIDRIQQAGRTETLLVVSAEVAPARLLERVADAKKAGAAIFALDQGDPELDSLVHESFSVRPTQSPVSFNAAQHLVSLAVGEVDVERGLDRAGLLRDANQSPTDGAARRGTARGRLARLLDTISGPQPDQRSGW